jgi:hypothetical protein
LREPAFASIAWGFDKLTHHGNGYAALPIGRMSQKKSIRGFFLDRRFARQISGLLSRPSMGFVIFIKYENPSVDFSGIAESLRNSACC